MRIKEAPLRRLWRWYRKGAVWGGLAVAAVLLDNLPLLGGYGAVSLLLPPLAGRRGGRVVGLLTGVTVGLLRDWTAGGFFGLTGVLLGVVGWLCGKDC